jgi:hypothetical protein
MSNLDHNDLAEILKYLDELEAGPWWDFDLVGLRAMQRPERKQDV